MIKPVADAGSGARTTTLANVVMGLVIGVAGGALANWLQLPLAWMIGAMVFTTIAAMSGLPVTIPRSFRGVMVAVLGVMLGAAFTPDMAARITEWWPSLLALALYCTAVTGSLMLYFRMVAGHDWVTSYFSAAPGGLNEMVIVGGEMGGDERTISLVHGSRVLLVVLVIPFGFMLMGGYDNAARPPLGDSFASMGGLDLAILAGCALLGAFGARALHIPAAFVTGPMALSAVVHLTGLTASKPPTEMVALAQVVIGVAVGCRFAGVSPARVARTLLEALGSTTIMLAVTLIFALALEPLAATSFAALVLSFAPGGLAEMSLIALALGIDAAFVSTHHIMRIIMVVIAAPLLFRLLRRRRQRE
ncbi:MAG: AbrB family transcriptional regulator [Alphaproteobacteria bacterium]|nr:AbrB family transcriptional regulator [Alphaproteobacteria bacterium]